MNETSLYEALGRSASSRRKALGKTQAEIAAKVEMSRASLANIERGKQKVLLHQVYRLADALEFPDVSDLLPLRAGDGTKPEPSAVIVIDGPKDGLTAEQRAQVERLVGKSTNVGNG